jgi:cob(I)alamin adenosyltransferase
MEEKKVVQIYYGNGKGKTTAAVGQCIRAASLGYRVIIIQFLKGKDAEEFCFLNKLEPDIKLFRFEKEDVVYSELSPEKQNDEKQNILNGFHFARKVLETGECDLLVLDEVLGLVDTGIVTLDDIIDLIGIRDDYYRLVMTGTYLPERLVAYADLISEIRPVKDMQ